jgi:hypothetical protein
MLYCHDIRSVFWLSLSLLLYQKGESLSTFILAIYHSFFSWNLISAKLVSAKPFACLALPIFCQLDASIEQE